MPAALLAAVVGALAGLVRRPLGAHLAAPVVRVPALALVAVVLQVAPAVVAPGLAGRGLGLSLALLCAFALLNRHLVGACVLATGLAANAAVVLLNGAMPVRAAALVRAGAVAPADLATADLGAGRRFARHGDVLGWLGDVVPLGALDVVVSLGDLVVLAGIGALVCDLVRQARGRRRLARPADPGRPGPTIPSPTIPKPTIPEPTAQVRRQPAGGPARSTSTAASPVQDWGTAPRPEPSSASQYSAHPDRHAPDTVLVLTDEATDGRPAASAASADR